MCAFWNTFTLAPAQVCQYLIDECGMDPRALVGPNAKQSRSPLHWAARNGCFEIVKWLVQVKGVFVDAPTTDGTTPLHYAVWKNHVAVCKFA